MKVAIVGNREGWNRSYIFDKIKKYVKEDDIIITGGADGVDTCAMDYAKRFCNQLIVFYPDKRIPSPDRYYQRNKKIVEECDLLIAFNRKKRSGTSNTIRYAKELEKKCYIHGGDEYQG